MVYNDTLGGNHEDVEQDDFTAPVKNEPPGNTDELEMTLHALLTGSSEHHEVSDPIHSAIEKSISEMELPDMMIDTPDGWDSLGQEERNFEHIGHAENDHNSNLAQLTVDRILAEHTLHGVEVADKLKRGSDDELEQDLGINLQDQQAEQNALAVENCTQENTHKTLGVYQTLSPASLSPTSDSESQYKHKKHQPHAVKAPTTNNTNTKQKSTLTQKVHNPTDQPAKFSEEFTMAQVADVKKRIINTHKLFLNFNFLKDGYARTSVELKRSLLRLKQSEIHRAHLMHENEQLRKLVLEQCEKLDVADVKS
ncbi:LAFA_0G08218g1_1 [Lachancea sp. 'fantastica']|nr:LAFA_0G08218g1_1 [Lachancea sp. 'fantastica']